MTQTQKGSEGSKKGSPTELDFIPIEDVLKQKPENIVIPASTEVRAEPDKKDFAHLFHHVECRSFKDFQTLGLIPAALEEKRVRKALSDDDDEALAVAHEHMRSHGSFASSVESNPVFKPSLATNYSAEYYRSYRTIRKTYNLNLSQLLVEAGLEPRSNNNGLRSMFLRTWMEYLQQAEVQNQGIPFTVCHLGDLTIQRDATFRLSQITSTLLAKDIRIQVGGRLVAESSYIRIRCDSVEGNLD